MKKKVAKTYLTDNPIQNKAEDQFDRWSFSQRIAQTIGKRDDSSGLVIGLYGEWGDGKTSALNLMERALKQYDDIVVTRFNPWYFQSEAALINGFFGHLAETIDSSIPTIGEKVVGMVKKYGGMLATVAASVTVAGIGVNVNPGAVHDAASGAQELGLEELRSRIEAILKKSTKRIVLLIDDIDRLDKEEIQQIFKLVRLSASFEKVTYVLAFDEKMVAAALREKYVAGEGDAGLKFIEKIVQVPLHLPPAYKEPLLNAVYAEIDKTLQAENLELTERDASSIGYEFQTSLGYALRTPRQVKRYANAIMFALPVLKEEVNVADLLLIEAIRVFYPNVYSLIRDNSEAFLHEGSRHGTPDKDRAATLEAVYKNIERDSQQSALKRLVEQLFPRIGNATYGDDWEKQWAEEKRICSRAYFRRYFSYGVPQGDVPDVYFNEFIRTLAKTTDNKAAAEHLKKFVKAHSVRAFLEKLVLIEGSLDKQVLKNIAYGVATNAVLFKDNGDAFFSDFSRAVTFVARVHARMPNMSDRDTFAADIISMAADLPFAVEEFMFMSREEKKPEAQQTMTVETEKRLGAILAERIAKGAAKTPPYSLKYGGARLAWHWKKYGDMEAVRAYFKQRLIKKPKDIADFLAMFVGTSYGSEGKHKSDFRKDSYQNASNFVSPADIAKLIKKSPYGKSVDLEQIHFNRKLPDSQRLVNQFMRIFQEQKTKKNAVGSVQETQS